MSYTTDLPASAKRLDRPGDRPRIREDDSGYSASDAWFVSYAHYPTAMDVIAGSAEVVSVNATLGVKFVPLRFKEHPFIIATNAEADFLPINPATGVPAGVIIKVDYRTPDYRLSGSDAWLDVSVREATFPLRMPAGAVTIGSNRNPEPIAWEVKGQYITISAKGLQSFNPAFFMGNQGIINSATWRGYPAFKVLFTAPEATQRTTYSGLTVWDASFPFQAREIDWRKDLDGSGALGNVQYGGTDRYAAVNFSSFFGF